MRLFVPIIGLTFLVVVAIAASGAPNLPLLVFIALAWLVGLLIILQPLLRQTNLKAPAAIADQIVEAPDVVADRARDILNAVPDPLLLIGQGREIIWANHAAERQFGGRLTGRNLMAVLRHPPLLAAIEAIRQGRGLDIADDSSLDAPLRLDIGHETDYQAAVVPLHAAGIPRAVGVDNTAEARTGRPRHDSELLILLRDVTAARRLDNLRSDFIANVSHELKTPLATLLGFIETMRGPAKDDPAAQERFLGIMHDQASRMTRMVSDLLSLSRIELHEHSRPRGTADLARVLGSVADGLGWKAQNRKIKLCLPDPDLLPCVPGDADELTQVFQNLIDNALKYGREGTKVTVEASIITDPVQLKTRLPGLRDPKGMVAIAIADQGDGIARQHLPRLTERFYRVDAARSRDLGGTGLGLAIVKHIVSHHRGSLDIASVLGDGSTFTVYLPLAE